jgi:hypothetical protein
MREQVDKLGLVLGLFAGLLHVVGCLIVIHKVIRGLGYKKEKATRTLPFVLFCLTRHDV